MSVHPDDPPSPRLHEGLTRYAERQARLLAAVGNVRTGSNRCTPRVASQRRPSIFDDLVAAITGASVPAEPATRPPRSRYMVRVAEVGKPHRPTRRNYDYFEELNAKLAAQFAEGTARETD